MDGENNGKPYFCMDDLGVPLFLETPIFFQFFFLLLMEEIPTVWLKRIRWHLDDFSGKCR